MSAQEGFHHPHVHSAHEASICRIQRALSTYGVLREDQILELLCHGTPSACSRSALHAAVRSGAIRRVGDVYALSHG